LGGRSSFGVLRPVGAKATAGDSIDASSTKAPVRLRARRRRESSRQADIVPQKLGVRALWVPEWWIKAKPQASFRISRMQHHLALHLNAIGFHGEQTFMTGHSKAAPKPRAVLTKFQAIAIFQLKLNQSSSSATKVATSYGVSAKTVRDIWTARTWATETWHLDPSRAVKIKQLGRPLGSRDSKPRKPKQSSVGGYYKSSVSLYHAVTESTSDRFSGVAKYEACLCEERPTHTESYEGGFLHRLHGQRLGRAEGRPGDYDLLCAEQFPIVPMLSLDDQLFEWERGQHGTCMSDPFKADLSQLRAAAARCAQLSSVPWSRACCGRGGKFHALYIKIDTRTARLRWVRYEDCAG
jgi:hypothetical protein